MTFTHLEAPTLRLPTFPPPADSPAPWASIGTDGRVHVRQLPYWLRNSESPTRPITDDDVLSAIDADAFGGSLLRDPDTELGMVVYLVREQKPQAPLNLIASQILGYAVRGPVAVVGGWDEETRTYVPLSDAQLDALMLRVEKTRTAICAEKVFGPPRKRATVARHAL